MPIPLTEAARLRVERLFRPEEVPAVVELLEHQCGELLPLWRGKTPAEFDRVRFAALKVSAGDLEALRRAVEMARTDWRDLLVAAGFAHDSEEHRRWNP